MSNAWLFASPWTGDIQNLHPVVLQETFEPVRCVPLTGVKVRARLVVFPGELDGFHGAQLKTGSMENKTVGVAIAHIPLGSLGVGS